MIEEYYTKEKGYSFFVLEKDERTLRETDVHEWRKCKRPFKGWRDEVNGWNIYTWFFGEKHNEHVTLWVTSIASKYCHSPHAVVLDKHWDTYEEAEAGHKEVVRQVQDGVLLNDQRGDVKSAPRSRHRDVNKKLKG